uniref:Pre-mRNA-splicing factor 38B n=2 Tax=Theria TaxID=32525 RepID=A0A7N4PRN1_SARHA
MANRTVKDAHSIHGTNPQYLVEKIIRTRIYESKYWKEECFGLTAELVVDKAMELRFVGGVYGGNIKPTPFLCLTLKMLQIQPEKDIIVEFIKNEDFKYVRMLGALYMRLTGTAIDCYKYLEPLYNDYRKIKSQNRNGEFELMHVDEFIDELLHSERVCDIILPRLQVRGNNHLAGEGEGESSWTVLLCRGVVGRGIVREAGTSALMALRRHRSATCWKRPSSWNLASAPWRRTWTTWSPARKRRRMTTISWREPHPQITAGEATETWTSPVAPPRCATGGAGAALQGDAAALPKGGVHPLVEKDIAARAHDATGAGPESGGTVPDLSLQATTGATDTGATQSPLKGRRKATRRAGAGTSDRRLTSGLLGSEGVCPHGQLGPASALWPPPSAPSAARPSPCPSFYDFFLIGLSRAVLFFVT